MTSLADGLPPEIAKQIHPAWRKNEADYWAVRDQLLGQYQDQFIAFADGAVLASGPRSVDVLAAIRQSDRHPFVIRVGRENEPMYRIRRTSFSYDTTYPSTALPVIRAEFRATSGATGVLLDRVIPDTGADTTILPWSDCQQLRLDPTKGTPGMIAGVGGGVAKMIGFLIWIWLDGQKYPCTLQADFGGQERILGRDVLNLMDVLFRGPSGEVVINP